MEAVKRTEP